MDTIESSGRAADAIIQQLEEQIQTGALADGEPLPSEREMMAVYGISRTVAREAVLALSNKGLVEAKPRYRPVVRKLGFDSAVEAVGSVVSHLVSQQNGVKNLFDTRTLVEAMLVREAAKGANKEHMLRLKEALQDNKSAINDSDLFYKTDMAFHGVLYEVTANPALPAVHKAYTTWLSPHWSQMERLPERNQENYEAHKRIFKAIQMRDPDEAEEALRMHLSSAWEQVRETFGDI